MEDQNNNTVKKDCSSSSDFAPWRFQFPESPPRPPFQSLRLDDCLPLGVTGPAPAAEGGEEEAGKVVLQSEQFPPPAPPKTSILRGLLMCHLKVVVLEKPFTAKQRQRGRVV